MERVSDILDEYDKEYSEIWVGDLSNTELEELDIKYPGYREMDVKTMDSELDVLSRKVRETEDSYEKDDIEREMKYVKELKKQSKLEGKGNGILFQLNIQSPEGRDKDTYYLKRYDQSHRQKN